MICLCFRLFLTANTARACMRCCCHPIFCMPVSCKSVNTAVVAAVCILLFVYEKRSMEYFVYSSNAVWSYVQQYSYINCWMSHLERLFILLQQSFIYVYGNVRRQQQSLLRRIELETSKNLKTKTAQTDVNVFLFFILLFFAVRWSNGSIAHCCYPIILYK